MAIVCATDFSEPAARAAEVAASMAASLSQRLVLVHAYEPAGVVVAGETLFLPDPATDARALDGIEDSLSAEIRRLEAVHPSLVIERAVAVGAPETVIVQQAQSAGATFVVVGSRGRRALARFLLGSVADRVARTAPMPVLVVRPESGPALRLWATGAASMQAVVGIGLDGCSDAPLEIASRFARIGRCNFDFVHAVAPLPVDYGRMVPLPPREEVEGEARRTIVRLLDSRGLTGSIDVRFGRAPQSVVDAVEQRGADLAIVGTHGRRGLERVLMGSVAESVLRRVPCSVVLSPCDWVEARASIVPSMQPSETHPEP